MRKTALAIVLAAVTLNCGKDKLTNSDTGIKVTISPPRMEVDLDTTFQFMATVTGTDNHGVSWFVQGTPGGDSINGTIDASGLYRAPAIEPGRDSVEITARSEADSTRDGHAWAVLVDPGVRYVSVDGSDQTGVGSKYRPFRTITRALQVARSSQTVMIGPGTYDIASGESFPLRVTLGISLHGTGPESTIIIGPAGRDPMRDVAVDINGDAITVENLQIKSVDGNGIGIFLRPGFLTKVLNTHIGPSFVGVYTTGSAAPRPMISGCRMIGDSIGVVTADSSQPIIRGCYIYNCRVYGIDIRDRSEPDLGVSSAGYPGHDTIQECGDYNYHYLINNGSPQMIYAIGNVWQRSYTPDNDDLIYDDEESGGTSGNVILVDP